MYEYTDYALQIEADRSSRVRQTLLRLARYLKAYLLLLALVGVLMLFVSWIQVLTPLLIGQSVDCYITPAIANNAAEASDIGNPSQSQTVAENELQACWFDDLPADATTADTIRGLGRLVVILVIVYVLGAVAGGAMFYLVNWIGEHVIRSLRVEVFAHLQRLSLSYYTKNEAGDLMSRITNDTETLQDALSFSLIQVLSGGILLIFIIFQMISLNWAYALICMSILPFMIYATVWFSKQARRAFRTTRTEMGNVNAELQENISSVREVQAFRREAINIEQFRQSNAANRDANIKAVSYTSALGPVLDALGYVGIALAIGVGGMFLLRGGTLAGTAVTLGLVVTFLLYMQQFNQPIRQISVLWTNVQSGIAGAERIFELLDESADIREMASATVMPPILGKIEFRNVSAEYNPGETVLKGITFTAEPGRTIALVGPTGAGKTTTANLIPRFYDVSSGEVRIDGIDVRDVTLSSLRGQIGIVLQDTFLFSDTISNNIRFGSPNASEQDVIRAAQLANVHDLIEDLPDGYETILGERGAGLSLGQRQLLAIARAALANPSILILDEATSSVDTRTERKIQAALESLMSGRTTIVIAHRLSTIRNANQILVLHDGEIVERGRHRELLDTCGKYYDLYMQQYRLETDRTEENGSSHTRIGELNPTP